MDTRLGGVLQTVGNCRWAGVDVMPYKEDGGTHFRTISRQLLFPGTEAMPMEWRYFEVEADGYSTLERHGHVHVVMVLAGAGRVLVGDAVTEIGVHDVVHIPPMTWHQFRADRGDRLGFLCLVAVDRDRPQRPTDEDLAGLRANPAVAEFVRV